MEIDNGPRMATKAYPEVIRQQRSMAKMFFTIVVVILFIVSLVLMVLSHSVFMHMP